MDWPTIILTGVSVVLGGLINWLFSRSASEELRQEAASLRRETEKVRHNSRAIITWLKEAGVKNPGSIQIPVVLRYSRLRTTDPV